MKTMIDRNFVANFMVFAFLQRRCHPRTRCIKKFLTSPVNYNAGLRRLEIVAKGRGINYNNFDMKSCFRFDLIQY